MKGNYKKRFNRARFSEAAAWRYRDAFIYALSYFVSHQYFLAMQPRESMPEDRSRTS
jgi:hypothetical protein